MEIVLQGFIGVGSFTIYTVPVGMKAKIVSLRVSNIVNAYTFKLSKYTYSTTTTYDIYDLSLAAKDTVTDTFLYLLEENDQLVFETNDANTSYLVYLQEYESN